VFQIKDDEIGLFGSPGTTGKPVGSDIRQGKKTLYSAGLLDRAAGADKDRFSAVFANPGASPADIGFVRDLAARLGVRDDVRRTMARLARKAGSGIQALPVREDHRGILRGLLEYSLDRRS
jgi:geranylgeranyl diphosphate synthase type I